jgi:hypothetical protein
MRARYVFVTLAVLALVAAWALYSGAVRVPGRYNPFAPLVIGDEPSFLTRLKLGRLARDPALCRRVLAGSGFRFVAVPDSTAAPGCEIENAIRIERTSVAVGTPFVMTCASAVMLAMWERHVLQPRAQAHFGQPVARLRHFGSFACRNVYGRDGAPRSRHATADAVDVAAFTLADGREVRVVADWTGDDEEAAFLRDVHRGACRFFDSVLGPDYNAAHRDHLHFDRGSYRVCH